MLNLRESIRATGLARKIVQGKAPATGSEAAEYLALCRRSEGDPSQTHATPVRELRKKTHPTPPLVMLFVLIILAFVTHQMPLLLFVPGFLFAAYLAWLHRQALDRISPPFGETGP